jgi:hypothetical protein
MVRQQKDQVDNIETACLVHTRQSLLYREQYLDTLLSPCWSLGRSVETADESFEGVVDKLVAPNGRDQLQSLQVLEASYCVEPDEDMIYLSTEKLIL